jgi:hypothetical protein
LGSVSATSALLLAADPASRLYFKPNANYSGLLATAITFRAWDRTSSVAGAMVSTTTNGGATAFSLATDTGSLTVKAVNDAPVLNAAKSPTLSAVAGGAGSPVGAVGTLVSKLVDFASPAGQVDNVTDVDPSALLGIAIIATDKSKGTWYYSTNNGSTWLALGAPSNTSARLLAADANTRLYFKPNAGFHGTIAAAITFRAWDRSAFANSGVVNTSTNGGTTAFSTASDTASIVVT